MKKKKGIRVTAVLSLLIVLAGSSFYYSIHYDKPAVWFHPDDLEKTHDTAKEPEWPEILYTGFKPESAFPSENTFCVYNGEEYLFLTREGKNLTGDT